MKSKPPFIPQESPETCAVACLRMLLAHHGQAVTEADLRSRCDLTQHGLHVEELCRLAEQYGFTASIEEESSIERLEELLGEGVFPIVYINRYPLDAELAVHSVVVVRVTRIFVTFLDPLRRERRLSRVKFQRAWRWLNRVLVCCRLREKERFGLTTG